MGTIQIDGSTPKLTIGNATAEDATILFDGNAQDFYIALDDSADDLLIGLGSTVGTTPAISIDENLAVKTYGDITMTGTTPTLTIGDAGAEDTAIVFDGNAQDFYIALDDSADDLLIGLGSTVGTTPIIAIDENKLSTFSGAVTVGVDDTGHDVKLFGATSGSFLLWDESADALLLTDSTPIQIGDAQDLTLYHDGSNSYITNKTGALKIATETSGIALTIGHTTSETTIADNLTVTGTATITGGQIVFPGTQVASAGANTLDDYEEGTYTAAPEPSTSGSLTLTAGERTGWYVKVGSLVTCGGSVFCDSVSSPVGYIKMTLPFANHNDDYAADSSMGADLQAGTGNLTNTVNGRAINNVAFMGIADRDSSGDRESTGAEHCAANTQIIWGGSYKASA
jgi:hypothetical protein